MINYLLLPLFLLVTGPALSQSGLPVTLSLPYDLDTIEENEATFVWQSNGGAMQSNPRISQQLVVVQLQGDQTASEALAINQPVFIRQDLVNSSIPYSSTDHELEKGKWYAWQVSLLFNGVVIQQSEAWKFILADPVLPKKQYIALRRQADGTTYQLTEPRLHIKLMESGRLSMKGEIRSAEGNSYPVDLLSEGSTEEAAVVSSAGELFCTADFSALNLPKGTYAFIWTSPDKRRHTLHFKLTN